MIPSSLANAFRYKISVGYLKQPVDSDRYCSVAVTTEIRWICYITAWLTALNTYLVPLHARTRQVSDVPARTPSTVLLLPRTWLQRSPFAVTTEIRCSCLEHRLVACPTGIWYLCIHCSQQAPGGAWIASIDRLPCFVAASYRQERTPSVQRSWLPDNGYITVSHRVIR